MTLLLICLFIMVLMPYLSKIPLAMAMKQSGGGYNNHYPREQQAQLQGFGARAVAAHQNSFEALTVFSIAILAAMVTQHTSFLIQVLAVVYVVSRVAYHALYLMDWALSRTLSWMVGYFCCLTILVQCIR